MLFIQHIQTAPGGGFFTARVPLKYIVRLAPALTWVWMVGQDAEREEVYSVFMSDNKFRFNLTQIFLAEYICLFCVCLSKYLIKRNIRHSQLENSNTVR